MGYGLRGKLVWWSQIFLRTNFPSPPSPFSVAKQTQSGSQDLRDQPVPSPHLTEEKTEAQRTDLLKVTQILRGEVEIWAQVF